MESSKELLRSIRPGMKLDRAFFLKIYGYELTWPGFRETAINALEDVVCSRAREYYDSIIGEYEKGYQEQMEEVGKWYLEECKKKWEKRQRGSEEQRKEQRRMRLQKWTELSEILNFQPTAKVQ